jgi:arylsulfatase A-like enzyme
MDAQLGRVLAELERLGLRDRTAIVLWGDHGWHLGDLGMWCKHTNFEIAVRAPLICSMPGQKASGRATEALVEFADIYPSLAEICGLPAPAGVEGTSFRPLLDDPGKPWKKAAFSQYPRSIPGEGKGMGYSLRTDRFRLTEWRAEGKEFREYELYDHGTDPHETENLAGRPEHAGRVRELAEILHAGWKAAVPSSR